MSRPWTELVQIVACYYRAGDVLDLDEVSLEELIYGDRLWWIDPSSPTQSVDECISEAEPFTLACDVMSFQLRPVQLGSFDDRDSTTGLIACELENVGVGDTFPQEEYAPIFKDIADRLRAKPTDKRVMFLTSWECTAGWDYFHEDYDSTIELIGYYLTDKGQMKLAPYLPQGQE